MAISIAGFIQFSYGDLPGLQPAGTGQAGTAWEAVIPLHFGGLETAAPCDARHRARAALARRFLLESSRADCLAALHTSSRRACSEF